MRQLPVYHGSVIVSRVLVIMMALSNTMFDSCIKNTMVRRLLVHSYLTHSFILEEKKKKEPPLIECAGFDEARKKYCEQRSLNSLFSKCQPGKDF